MKTIIPCPKGTSGAGSIDDIRYEEYWKQRELLNKTTCSNETLYEYLYKIDPNKAINYAKTGLWPDDIQIPKSTNVLGGDWGIDWTQVPNGGYTLDAGGNAIKSPHTPEMGEVVDRYGPANGRYTSPVIDDTPYSYDQRSLPYVEDPNKYHQFEVVGDFTKIQDYVENTPDIKLRTEVELTLEKYKLSYEDLVVQAGDIADGFGASGGGVQYEFPLSVEILERLGLVKEIGN